ncbi:MAG TPA: hypothetical protein VN176_10050 [Verrucomicrobiae bacterium]|jgi:hypothetical protein|nr:hypothetical protein [Verrucomicrobiae bacterium]
MPAILNVTDKTISIEFANGVTHGPIERNPTTEVLCKMIANLDGRLHIMEQKKSAF